MTDQNVSERVSDELRDGGYSLRTPQFSIEAAYEKARSTIASLQAELESVKARNVALERVAEQAAEVRRLRERGSRVVFEDVGDAWPQRSGYGWEAYADWPAFDATLDAAALEDTTDG